jgi:hypothetical protein
LLNFFREPPSLHKQNKGIRHSGIKKEHKFRWIDSKDPARRGRKKVEVVQPFWDNTPQKKRMGAQLRNSGSRKKRQISIALIIVAFCYSLAVSTAFLVVPLTLKKFKVRGA